MKFVKNKSVVFVLNAVTCCAKSRGLNLVGQVRAFAWTILNTWQLQSAIAIYEQQLYEAIAIK